MNLKKLNLKDAVKAYAPGASYVGDKLFGGRAKGTTQPGNEQKDQAMADYNSALEDFEKNGNNQYSWQGDLADEDYSWLGDLENEKYDWQGDLKSDKYNWLGDLDAGPGQGNTEYDKITGNAQNDQFEQQALRDLEQQSKDGLSMRDQADLAQLEGQVNRQNAGRIGAIQQNMAARGMGGSGMELVAQMQASQDATERQALASMEKAAMAQEGRRGATALLGQQAGQMSARDFQQQAQRSAAQDAINRFNTANQQSTAQLNWHGQQDLANQNVGQSNQDMRLNWQGRQELANQNVQQNNQTAQYNHQGRQSTANQNTQQNNQTAQYNHQGRQGNANQNVAQNNEFARQKLGGRQGAAQIQYNVGTDKNNMASAQDEAQNANKRMIADALIKGGSAAAGKMYAGGVVPGKANVPGDHPANDTVPTMLSPGEVVIPRSVAQKDHNSDAIDSLLKAMASMQKKGKQ